MLKTTIREFDEQGRIIVPKEWREELGIKKHTKAQMTKIDGEIKLIPLKRKSLMDFKGTVGGGDVVDIEEGEKAEMEAAIKRFEKARR